MQSLFDYWLPRLYPRLNKEAFSALLREVHVQLLPTDEFQYIVLGCGYLYRVRPHDPEKSVRRLKRQISAQYGQIAAEALVDEGSARKIRALAKKNGLLIGPQSRQLSDRRKPGQVPRPASKIAALAIARWVAKRRPELKLTPWACDLYRALTDRSLSEETFERYQKHAGQELVEVWKRPSENVKVPAIEHLIEFFDSRYKRFQRDGFPVLEANRNPGLLYPIDFLEPVLRAAEIEIKDKKIASFFG